MRLSMWRVWVYAHWGRAWRRYARVHVSDADNGVSVDGFQGKALCRRGQREDMHIEVLLYASQHVRQSTWKKATTSKRLTKTTSFWSVAIESLPALNTQSTRVLNDSMSPVLLAFFASTTSVMVGFVKCCHSWSASERPFVLAREYLVSSYVVVAVVERDMRGSFSV